MRSGEYSILSVTEPIIIYPPNDSYMVTFMNPVQLMCSLNINISSSVTVTWLHNGSVIMTPPNEVTTTGNTTILLIGNPQPSNSGVYQCVFNNSVNGWSLSRNISLSVIGMFL